MPGGHEILTLQFGGFANYVGSHYWNIQDEILGLQASEHKEANEINSDILFREGVTSHGESTYTPRLLLFDSKGSLGALPPHGALYTQGFIDQRNLAAPTWQGRQEVHRAPQVPKTSFQEQLELEQEAIYSSYENTQQQTQQLEQQHNAPPTPLEIAAGSLELPGAVRYFTDYLKTHLHPRSSCLLSGSWDTGTIGDTSASSSSRLAGTWNEQQFTEGVEEASERIRVFAEKCDSLRGFQFIVQESPSWGGLANKVLEELRDEYHSRSVLVFAVRPPDGSHSEQDTVALQRRRVERALFLASLTENCDLYVPMAAPVGSEAARLSHLSWRRGSWFHESGLIAAALDSVTLPYRLQETSSSCIGRTDLWSLTQLVAGGGANLAAVQLGLPCASIPEDPTDIAEKEDTRTHRNHGESGNQPSRGNQSGHLLDKMASATPGVLGGKDALLRAECVVLRGARSANQDVDLSKASTALESSLQHEGVRAVRHLVIGKQPLPVPLPFPRLFGPTVSRYGDIVYPAAATSNINNTDVVSSPMITRLYGSKALRGVVEGAERDISRAWHSGPGQAALEAWGLDREEQQEKTEYLTQMKHSYDDDED